LGGAVSAGTVQLAVVFNVEVDDVHGTASIVLNYFIGSVKSTAANHPRLSARLVLFDRECILTNVFPPDKLHAGVSAGMAYLQRGVAYLQSAMALTVDAFSLVLAYNNIAEGCARLQQKDGVGSAWHLI
jgi:hypothetical protein